MEITGKLGDGDEHSVTKISQNPLYSSLQVSTLPFIDEASIFLTLKWAEVSQYWSSLKPPIWMKSCLSMFVRHLLS